jgi:DNA-binding NarL/FixJ family response regulator
MPIRLLIADDLVLFRQGLGLLLANEDSIQISGEAENGLEALHKAAELQPDVVITDIQMPEMDGIEFTKELKLSYPNIPVIALTMFKEEHLIVDMLNAGAKGYLQKSADRRQVLEAIRSVREGGWYYCESTTMKLSKLVAKHTVDGFTPPPPGLFTETELQIIQLICAQYSSKEIAAQLFKGERTVESYRHKIFEKMGVKNMAGLVIYAIRAGMFKP